MGGSAPKADPKIGEAALLSASTGRQMLDWMRGQAQITNGWAREDRARYESLFRPMENRLVREANTIDSDANKQKAVERAVADVRQQSAIEDAGLNRQMMAMGVNPNSRRFNADKRRSNLGQKLAAAGAANMARRQVDAQGDSARANLVNLGRGMAVNPATSMQLSSGAMQSGFNGAMQGFQQQGSLLNTQYQNQLQQWEANQGALGAIGGALGTVAGALPWATILSSRKMKEDFTDVDSLGAVRKMPVKGWKYKDGVADGGKHVGPIAEDFQKATGVGDGKTIDPISAIGVTMGAVQQLADKVDAMASRMEPMGARRKAA